MFQIVIKIKKEKKKTNILWSRLTSYHPFFWTEIAPRLANHLSELTFSVWEEGFELVMLFSKEEIVSTPIGFWIVGISPSFAFPSTARMRFACVWYDCVVRLRNWTRRAFIYWMIQHSSQNLWTYLHSHHITTVEFPINCSNTWKTWSKDVTNQFIYMILGSALPKYNLIRMLEINSFLLFLAMQFQNTIQILKSH